MESTMFSLVLDFSEYWEWIVVLQDEEPVSSCKEKSLAETAEERFTPLSLTS